MNKKKVIFTIALTVTTVILLAILVGTAINSVNHLVEESCFNRLSEVSIELADDLKDEVEMDRTILIAMSEIIARSDNLTDGGAVYNS